MGWVILGLLLVLGLPLLLVVLGVALAFWATLAVAGLVWGVLAFVFHLPVIGLLVALGAGIAIGRATARA
ncbi:hypothetical protein [Paracraurococcus ruber]|uniref:Major facilitator superfamily (MFS) profile domain-containing protein n=1 Tax=Paracraurococcus ruber TaxID=77675 RepID=A0ABS1CRX1_9PROT|nr:hypothetical protein [Paracraurococcus ruber]MBK1657118.1 hypothetical protein [Paracraurococcus ruber]TDG31711.1 hypothetical protein E2C05_10030 [Paracraurococcus ruber]